MADTDRPLTPTRHDGLTRGTSHLRSCATGEIDCKSNAPHLIRYDGYRSLQEPVDQIVPCMGPRGLPLNESQEDAIWAYPGHADGKLDETEPKEPATHIHQVRWTLY